MSLKQLSLKKGVDESTVEFEYDDLYRQNRRIFPSGPNTEIEYDTGSRPIKMVDASGEQRYDWDDANRLLKLEQGDVSFTTPHYTVECLWNEASQRVKMILTIGNLSPVEWEYEYTDNGQFETIINPDGDETLHEYLTDDRLKKITLKADTADKKSTREYFYQDTDNSHAYVSGKNKHLRRTLDKKQSGAIITEFNYELDKAGIRLSMADKDGKYRQYGHDPNYWLVSETMWTAKTGGTRAYQYGFAYDPNGNRILEHIDGVMKKYLYGDNNEMLEAGNATFTYDEFGNTKTKTIGTYVTTYHYDFERNLIKIEFPSGPDDEHQYDGNGQRRRSKLAGASLWTNFVHDPITGDLIAEYIFDDPDYIVKTINTYGFGLISANRENEKQYFHFDGLGSVWVVTDYDEDVLDAYEWNAFGQVAGSIIDNSIANPYRYVGQWGCYDDGAMGSQSGLALLGRRYYDTASARFLTWDIIPSLNRYLYVSNNATNAVDPSGCAIILIAVVVVIAAGIAGCGEKRYECENEDCVKMCNEYQPWLSAEPPVSWEGHCKGCCWANHKVGSRDLTDCMDACHAWQGADVVRKCCDTVVWMGETTVV